MLPYQQETLYSSFATKHFQRKLLKIFDLHLPLRRLVLFVAWIITWKVRCWVTDTDTQTDTQTKYCNPRCACTPRLINHYHEIAIPNTQSPQHNWWNLVLPTLHPAQWVTSIFVFSQEDIWLTDCLCQPTHEWSLSHIFRQKAGLHGHVDVIQNQPLHSTYMSRAHKNGRLE